MPFTFSHPAIILPLHRFRWLSLTGLVMGSLTPDFEYFIRMNVSSAYSHSLPGLFWFDVPLGIGLAFVFHNHVRNPLINHLPGWLAFRFSVTRSFSWNAYFKRHWFAAIVSILIGAFSHILWDAFTHEHGFAVSYIPVLSETIKAGNFRVAVFKCLQHGSTILGAISIGYFVRSLPVLRFGRSYKIIRYWLVVSAVTAAVVLVRMIAAGGAIAFGHVVVTMIAGFMIGLMISSLVYRFPE